MPYQPFAPAENLRPFDNIDGLISKLQCGEVMTSIWRQLSLLLIATFSSCFSERPLNLLIITDDTNIINKLVARLPEHQALNEESFAQKIFKIYSSKHIQGKNYTVSTGTTLEHEGCLYLENIEMLKPAELSSLAYNARKCGLIACCPFRGIKNVAFISREFDLVISLHELLHHDILASASFIWASCTQNDKLALDSYFSKGPLPISCETLLKKYFLASRSVIGNSNDMALFPLYDPSRQQSFGIQLARAFQAIRCDEGMAREDVLLSLVVQEINLMHRLGSTVFQDKREEGVGQVMPSPSPSIDARVPNGPSHTGPSTFASRYGQVIRAIQIQLNLS